MGKPKKKEYRGSFAQQLSEVFDDGQLIVICEIARIAFADAEIYEKVLDETDLIDKQAKDIQDTLVSLMDEQEKGG
jgi:hypothetical protein